MKTYKPEELIVITKEDFEKFQLITSHYYKQVGVSLFNPSIFPLNKFISEAWDDGFTSSCIYDKDEFLSNEIKL